MIPKKSVLFSASLLLVLLATAALAQQPSQATPPAQATTPSPGFTFYTDNGGNYLGVTATEVTRENMGRYNLREPRGVAVTRVAEGSPAQRAGLMANDVILRFDNEQVTTYRKLQRLISEAAPEQTVRLTISRNGSEQEITVTLGRRQNSLQALSRVYGAQQQSGADAQRALEQLRRNQGTMSLFGGRRIGITTTQLTKQLADYFGVTGGRGVLVTTVADGSPAARAGLKAGDVIVDVDGERVETSGDLSRAINRKSEGDITLTIVRDRAQQNIRVTPEKRAPGAISISPEILEIEPVTIEIPTPTVDISLPQIKIPVMPRITIPKIKIKPEQLRQLQKLEELNQRLEAIYLL